MTEFILVDLTGYAVMTAGLLALWQWPSIALLAGILVSNTLLVVHYGHGPVTWQGLSIFPAQFPPIFSCCALLIAHLRLGGLVAHRAWRMAIAATLLNFMFVTRFSAYNSNDGSHIAEQYQAIFGEHQRLWWSALLQLVFLGGVGQALWKMKPPQSVRYPIMFAGFLLGSLAHSFVVFFGDANVPWNLFAETALYTLLPTAICAAVMLSVVLFLETQWPQSEEDRASTFQRVAEGVKPKG